MVRHEVLRGRDAEALREDGAERRHLHLPEPRESADAPAQVVAVDGVGPHAFRTPAVLVVDHGGELLYTPGHRAREAVDRRLLAEERLEGARVRLGDVTRLERPESLFQLERAHEGCRHGYLLVEEIGRASC